MDLEMNMFWAVVLLPVGLLILIKGADLLVDGAVGLAERFGVSPLVIGLTIVAMGTSAPEVAASVTAALKGKGDMALGNVYGSNIANLAMVGGICAMVRPIRVNLSMLRRELPVMVGVVVLLWPFINDLMLDRWECGILLGVFAVLIGFAVWNAKRQGDESPAQEARIDREIDEVQGKSVRSFGRNTTYTLIGLVALAVGARLAVAGAEFIGESAGLSPAVIGCTILAVGTSLPELITCLVAAFKGHDDLSIGNLVGSNIFNTLLVVGGAGVIRPFVITSRLIGTDYLLMVGTCVVFMLIAMIAKKISRLSGAILACFYVGYLIYMFAFPVAEAAN